jgi:hypothetical protein
MEKSIKIGTINLDWCKKSNYNIDIITDIINRQNFDFLIVTENIESYEFDTTHYCAYHSKPIPIYEEYEYMDYGKYLKGKTPVRVSIYTPCEATGTFIVEDIRTSVAHSFHFRGLKFILYGAIVGTWGIKYQEKIAFNELQNFKNDIEYLKTIDKNIIIAGDLNTSFYPGEENRQLIQINSREQISDFSEKEQLSIITRDIPENIDHILVSETILAEYDIETSVFMTSTILNDKYHKGVMIELTEKTNET